VNKVQRRILGLKRKEVNKRLENNSQGESSYFSFFVRNCWPKAHMEEVKDAYKILKVRGHLEDLDIYEDTIKMNLI
jgi:hypothetical protein